MKPVMRTRMTSDENYRCTIIMPERRNPIEPWVRSLAASVLVRAFRDVIPRQYAQQRDNFNKRIKRTEALDWVNDNGEGFRYWCYIASVSPDAVRAAVLKASRGILPDNPAMRRFTSKTPAVHLR